MNLDPVWAFSEEEECEEERVRKSTRCHSLQDTEPETVFVVFQISVLNERFLLAECQPVVNHVYNRGCKRGCRGDLAAVACAYVTAGSRGASLVGLVLLSRPVTPGRCRFGLPLFTTWSLIQST